MDSLEVLVVVAHVVVAIAVIGLVLLQHGKGADAGAAFGAGASQTVFGSQGTGSFLSKTTALLALIFFLTSFGLAYLAKQKSVSVESNPLGLPQTLMDGRSDQAEDQPAIDADMDNGTGEDVDGSEAEGMIVPESEQGGESVQTAPKVEDDEPAAIDSEADMPQIDAVEAPGQSSAPE